MKKLQVLKNIKNNYLNIVQLFNIDNGSFQRMDYREIDKIKIQIINILNITLEQIVLKNF